MLGPYILAVVHPLAVAAIKLALPDVGVEAPFLMFLSAIVFVTACGGWLPGLVAAVMSASAAAVYFVPPAGEATPATVRDLGQLLVFGIEAVFVVAIVGTLRRMPPRTIRARRTA